MKMTYMRHHHEDKKVMEYGFGFITKFTVYVLQVLWAQTPKDYWYSSKTNNEPKFFWWDKATVEVGNDEHLMNSMGYSIHIGRLCLRWIVHRPEPGKYFSNFKWNRGGDNA
jgi:hypothetical protein